jgi:hypothetical protein
VVAFHDAQTLTLDLGTGADPAHLELWFEGRDMPHETWLAYLTDFDAGETLGTLTVRSPRGEELEVGRRAPLEWVYPDLTGRAGHALLDVEGETGTLVRWEIGTATRVVAERVQRRSEGGVGVHVNYDGVAADVAFLNGLGGLTVELTRVPPKDYYYTNQNLSRAAVITDFDGRTGRLSRIGTSFRDLHLVSEHVIHPHHGFIDQLFSGMAWITSTDARRGTGRLEYRNDDLGFSATVSDGVADFLQSTRGFIYSVPYGDRAGVWFAEAK